MEMGDQQFVPTDLHLGVVPVVGRCGPKQHDASGEQCLSVERQVGEQSPRNAIGGIQPPDLYVQRPERVEFGYLFKPDCRCQLDDISLVCSQFSQSDFGVFRPSVYIGDIEFGGFPRRHQRLHHSNDDGIPGDGKLCGLRLQRSCSVYGIQRDEHHQHPGIDVQWNNNYALRQRNRLYNAKQQRDRTYHVKDSVHGRCWI